MWSVSPPGTSACAVAPSARDSVSTNFPMSRSHTRIVQAPNAISLGNGIIG
jgi:hypothetical protein